MDLKRELLKEHSKSQRDKILHYVGDSPARFKALVEVYLQGPYRVTQRAAWPLSYVAEKHPTLIKPHLKKILDYLKKPDVHDAVKRNTVRLLQFVDIPKKLYGQVADVCFGYLQDPKEPVAIRVFSMTVLSHIAADETELKKEVTIIIEDQLPYASAAFRSRAKKVLKELS
jgi:hypothetical protein